MSRRLRVLHNMSRHINSNTWQSQHEWQTAQPRIEQWQNTNSHSESHLPQTSIGLNQSTWDAMEPQDRYRLQWEQRVAQEQVHANVGPFYQGPGYINPAIYPVSDYYQNCAQPPPISTWHAYHTVPFAPLRPTAPAFAPHEHDRWNRIQQRDQFAHPGDPGQPLTPPEKPHRRRPRRGDRRSDRRTTDRQPDAQTQHDSSGSSTPVPFERRKKAARASGAPPPPSESYLASTLLPVSTYPAADRQPEPPLLILDLNNTLLCRRRRDPTSSKRPIVRPYLSSFLQYVCGRDKDGQRRWNVSVYSSAALHNVLSLLEAVRLVSVKRAHDHDRDRRGQGWDALETEPLRLVWSREKMGLTAKEFELNVETVKDLDQIFNAMPGFGSERTVLLDDESGKAAQHPYNHVPILPFIIDPDSVSYGPTNGSPHRVDHLEGRQRSPRASSQHSVPDRRSRSPSPGNQFGQHGMLIARGLELPPGHDFYNDTSLLSTIYVLDQLRLQRNMGAFLRQVGIEGLELQDEHERVEAGRRICERLDIDVVREWKEDWWDHVS